MEKGFKSDAKYSVQVEKDFHLATLYPKLSNKEMQQWVEGEGIYAPLIYVLDNEGEIIGEAAWEMRKAEVTVFLVTLE